MCDLLMKYEKLQNFRFIAEIHTSAASTETKGKSKIRSAVSNRFSREALPSTRAVDAACRHRISPERHHPAVRGYDKSERDSVMFQQNDNNTLQHEAGHQSM